MTYGNRGVHDTSPAGVLQIGEVAARVGLSLRTVRYYEQAGLLMPASRTAGGFRLYDDNTLDRLLLIKKMKPLGFTLEEMRSLIMLREELRGQTRDTDFRRREEPRRTWRAWMLLADEKLAALHARVRVAEEFVEGLRHDLDRADDAQLPHQAT